jgi:NhaP-type Na+/H+ or K+/H+ antiporter
MSSASTRVQTQPFWEALKFMLESTLFLLVGLQLPAIVADLPGDALGTGIAEGAAVVGAVVLVRAGWMLILWVVPALPSLTGRMFRRLGEVPIAAERLSGRELVVLGYSGMRGALSLAGALSIPLIAGGRPFPARDEVIFLVYVVVIGTLLVPSLTLEPLVRRLGLAGDEELAELELRARARIVHAALARLEELAEEGAAGEETVERLRATFELRLDRIGGPERDGARSEGTADAAGVVRRMRSELIDAERRALEELRDELGLPAQILARIHRDIDLDETRLHV